MTTSVSALFTSRDVADTAIRHLARAGFGLDRMYVREDAGKGTNAGNAYTVSVVTEDQPDTDRAHDVLAAYIAADRRALARAAEREEAVAA